MPSKGERTEKLAAVPSYSVYPGISPLHSIPSAFMSYQSPCGSRLTSTFVSLQTILHTEL